MDRKHGVATAFGAAAIAAIVIWTRAPAPVSPTAALAPSAASAPSPSAAPAPSESAHPVRSPVDAGRPPPLLSARWGSGQGELGHHRQAEGNAEGPMSFALDGADLVVLDQVNSRVVRYDSAGHVAFSRAVPNTTQDIAVASDGSIAVLDRLAQKSVTILGPSGRVSGELPVVGKGIEEAGLTTGVFVDGKDVYVERAHGALVLLGSLDGNASDARTEIVGRPSKDGVLLVSAAITDAPTARVVVNAFDRAKNSLRFTRKLVLGAPLGAIVLLDTDRRGTIYLGAERIESGVPAVVQVICLEPSHGETLGKVELPTSGAPEESLRDYAVRADGTIVVATRSETGVEYRAATCP